jgi:predicted ferric reductase
MDLKINLGYLVVILICVLTILIWLFVRDGTYMFEDYEVATHSLGQLTGLVGMVLFALTFPLITKAKWIIFLFGDYARVLKAHHFMGAMAFILILFHPALLVLKFIPNDIKQAAIYLLPSETWSVNYGIIALVGFALLMLITMYVSMANKKWRPSHKLLGVIYTIAILHVFLVPTDITDYLILKIYMVIIVIIGLIAFCYSTAIPTIKKRFFTKKQVDVPLGETK